MEIWEKNGHDRETGLLLVYQNAMKKKKGQTEMYRHKNYLWQDQAKVRGFN